VAVAGVALLVVGGLLVSRAVRDDESGSRARPVVARVREAGRSFPSLTAGTIRVGQRDLDVVIADDVGEQIQGLRGRSDAAPYAGMLFVYDGDSTGPFTMAGVPGPLDIAFFSADGRRVDQLRMTPCRGTDATCPAYASSAPYRYALETAAGEMPGGRLRVR
jgi:uncharacterized membrane protein (UPF0127 family)